MDDLVFSSSDTYFSFRQSKIGAFVVWKVEHFSILKAKVVISPKFTFQKVDWYLNLYPLGVRESSSGHVGLFLKPCSNIPAKLNYRFFLKEESGQNVKVWKWLERDFSDGEDYGFSKLINKQDLLDGTYGNLLSGDILTVCCALEPAEISDTDASGGITKPILEKFVLKFAINSFPSNFREVFDNGKFSDVVLRVGKETIRAHKMILSTQSSVFKAMFESDMKECRENSVELIDIDATVAKAMLLYMYTREVEGLSNEDTLELYAAADKYMLTELKEKCSDFLSNHLSPKNVGEVFEIASLHSDDPLVKSVLKFFADNAKNIIITKEWKDFSNEKPASSVKLLSFAITSNVFL